MIENKDCWLKDRCNRIDCDKPTCMRLFKLDKLYELALIPLNMRRHITFVLDKDKKDLEAFKRLKNIENDIMNFVNEGCSLYLHSQNTGNGKTYFALRLVEDYFDKIWASSPLKCRALFIDVPRFLLALKDNIEEKQDYITHIKSNVLDCDIVIWDDIGTKTATSYEAENLLSMINARINNGKSNIFTSNLNANEIHEYFGDRLASRIVNASSDIELFGADKRGLF